MNETNGFSRSARDRKAADNIRSGIGGCVIAWNAALWTMVARSPRLIYKAFDKRGVLRCRTAKPTGTFWPSSR